MGISTKNSSEKSCPGSFPPPPPPPSGLPLIVALRLVFTSDGVGIVIRSAERYDLVKSNCRSRMQNTHSAYDSVAYDSVKTALSESEAEVEE